MGYYINPTNGQTKEQWLEQHATGNKYPRIPPKTINDGPEGTLPVVLVDNFAFTAAGICYSQCELEDFSMDDGRLKFWYFVPVAKLIEVEPSVAGVIDK